MSKPTRVKAKRAFKAASNAAAGASKQKRKYTKRHHQNQMVLSGVIVVKEIRFAKRIEGIVLE